MADIVNLRQARKIKARAERERAAEQNRLIHGRTKAETALAAIEGRKLRDLVDGHRRERDEPGTDE